MKLGYQILNLTPEAKASLLRTPPKVLKIVGPSAIDVPLLEAWRNAQPDGVLYFRDDRWEVYPTVDERVWQLLTISAPIRHLVDYYETGNETKANGDELNEYRDETIEALELLHASNLHACIGNFPEGNPANLADWVRFYPALRAAREYGGRLGAHEYSSPTMQADKTWRCLRCLRAYAMFPEDCRIPLSITEAGLDWTGRDHSFRERIPEWGEKPFGWRAHNMPPADYAQQISWYLGELQSAARATLIPADVDVLLYASGTFGDFKSFDIAGVPEIEDLFRRSWTISTPDPTREDDTVPQSLAEQYPDLYAEWVAAGGIEHAFDAHLMGIGQIPADLTLLSGNVESAWSQLKNQLPLPNA